MVTHQAFLILADPTRCSASLCQRAIRIFGEYDLSLPRALVCGELDKRFNWSPGSAQKTLNMLVDTGILSSMSHGRMSSGGMHLFILSREYSWTPSSLSEQWKHMQVAADRATVASAELS